MKHAVGVLASILTLSSTAAFANAAAGDACSMKLTGDSFLIYAASMAGKPTRGNWQSVVEAQTKSLVSANRIAAGSARDSEIAAGSCVKAAVE